MRAGPTVFNYCSELCIIPHPRDWLTDRLLHSPLLIHSSPPISLPRFWVRANGEHFFGRMNFPLIHSTIARDLSYNIFWGVYSDILNVLFYIVCYITSKWLMSIDTVHWTFIALLSGTCKSIRCWAVSKCFWSRGEDFTWVGWSTLSCLLSINLW